jgi:hypothetical protein
MAAEPAKPTLAELCAEAEELLREAGGLVASAQGDVLRGAEDCAIEAARRMKSAIEAVRQGAVVPIDRVRELRAMNDGLGRRVEHALRFHEGLLQALGVFAEGYTRKGAAHEMRYRGKLSVEV